MKLPPSPLIYEINTWPWLTELARLTGRPVDLASVPDDQWDAIAALGFDAVWLMGVWRRSPAGVAIARADKLLMEWFARSLDDFTDDDVVGSPYCVCDYVVDDHLGGDDALAVAREQLARRGVGLILAGACLLLTRPRVWANASYIRVRNVFSTKTLPWGVIRDVGVTEGSSWGLLDLHDDDQLSMLGLQVGDGQYAVNAMRRLRVLHAASSTSKGTDEQS